jgi:hypothetical protein
VIKLGKLKIEPRAIASQGNAILGIRDSGKTYTATWLAERLQDSGIPFVAFDPIGVWRFLRVPGKGAGYPVVVAGGADGDLPLTVAGAPEIVRAAMANGISLVIDLFDINLSKADWKRIVTACVRVLLHENSKHGLRHVFIEEAAEFAPQRVGPDQGQVYAEMEKLARMGGNSRLGYTLINQRAEEVNKALLELCDNLFLHRQKGRNSLTALSKWLDIGNVAAGREIVSTLPTLPTGECWAWLQGSETPELVKVPAKNSLHPDRRIMRGDEPEIAAKAVDVGSFVTTMRGTLQEVAQEARSLVDLQAEVKRLGKELTAANKRAEQAGVPEAEVQRRVRDAVDAFKREHPPSVLVSDGRERKALERIVEIAQKVIASNQPGSPDSREADATPQRAARLPRAAATPAPAASGAGSSKLPAGERTVLTAIAQHPNGVTREQLTVLTGYKRSTRDAYLQRMREKFLITPVPNSDRIEVTPEGKDALGADFQPLPTGEALQQHWLAKLPEGESRILGQLCASYPDSVSREEIGHVHGYARSSRDAYLQRLKARQLVTIVDRGFVRAATHLFDGARS